HRHFWRELEVRHAAHASATEKTALPCFAPDQRVGQSCALFHDLFRPDLYVRTDNGVIANLGSIGKNAILANQCTLADVHAARAYAFAHARFITDAAIFP